MMTVACSLEIEKVETALLSLLKGKYTSLHISFNEDSSINYRTAREEFKERYSYDEGADENGFDPDSWISKEDFNKAMNTNSVWCAHWYPNTPVGFCRIYASSLSVLLGRLFSIASEENE